MIHRLKCWAENFDAIATGKKRADVRVEDDRTFSPADLIEFTRTDREGRPTEPRTQLLVEILHVDRYAGPHELIGRASNEMNFVPIAVLSLGRGHSFAAREGKAT